MANGNLIVNDGRKIVINRSFKVVPDYTAPSAFKVGTGTNTPSIADTNLQTSVFSGTVLSGYPIIDETTFMVTNRCLLGLADANGNSITEFGLFNTDGSPLMFSRAVFTAISKTSSIQVVFVEKDQIV